MSSDHPLPKGASGLDLGELVPRSSGMVIEGVIDRCPLRLAYPPYDRVIDAPVQELNQFWKSYDRKQFPIAFEFPLQRAMDCHELKAIGFSFVGLLKFLVSIDQVLSIREHSTIGADASNRRCNNEIRFYRSHVDGLRVDRPRAIDGYLTDVAVDGDLQVLIQ